MWIFVQLSKTLSIGKVDEQVELLRYNAARYISIAGMLVVIG